MNIIKSALYKEYKFSVNTIDDYDKIAIIYNNKSSEQYYLLISYKNGIDKIKIKMGN